MNRQTSISLLILLITLLLAQVVCGEKQTPEEEVRQYIETGKSAIEKRDVIGLSDLISENYVDAKRLLPTLIILPTVIFDTFKSSTIL